MFGVSCGQLVRALGIAAPLAIVTAISAHGQELRIATEGYYAPLNFLDEDGELAGFDMDIADALCTEMGVECELV